MNVSIINIYIFAEFSMNKNSKYLINMNMRKKQTRLIPCSLLPTHLVPRSLLARQRATHGTRLPAHGSVVWGGGGGGGHVH